MKRKICVVTTSRADYGLLYWLMWELDHDSDLELQVVVTGMHLAPQFGLTSEAIVKDGFSISRKVDMLLSSDTESAAIKSIGVGLISFADVLQSLEPHIVVLLGDRYELYSAAIAALLLKIPIAHIHGGETSQGAIDEAVRHSVTKMASIHFPATEVYRQRIIQMGEAPERVFNYGAPGLDSLYRMTLMDKEDLESYLKFDLTDKMAIVTYHPVTLEKAISVEQQVENLLEALQKTDVRAVFTKANADVHGSIINRKLSEFCHRNPDRYKLFDSIGQIGYLSCLRHFDLMIGNSSSGLIEAPSFKLPVVNIGNRQAGRLRAPNVLDVGYETREITETIEKAVSPGFREKIFDIKNPYDPYEDGLTSKRIRDKLKEFELGPKTLMKQFRDINSGVNDES
jgi:UDP-N-acetylglucosamine 2-epimerase (non-hydrolysing)/GDP/UDP-N,N'-diacetylbacillosamine 2-epimerase (hydrolysing)